ncbi:AbiJ-NTD4 domain-containing protein [Acinetobacter kanungonis]|uniref:AbiJ-NTD4 domain-containing protein n=1 Tax=Acinetobacter kanungonis TaxID=2699469 RepID=UPI00137B25BC|nr:hypothetical protein [Acinetobacter kanungonis]NCI77898.1 hypothetical protein [Acinetobacter kanungonis]
MGFSERYGYKPVREIIQKESIDDILKNKLWSILYDQIFEKYSKYPRYTDLFSNLISKIWIDLFKLPLDEKPSAQRFTSIIKKYLYDGEWYIFYDLIEFIVKNKRGSTSFGYTTAYSQINLINAINEALETEASAYRIINEQITEITSEQEIQSIEDALENTNPYAGVQQHLNQALKLMSDRQKPDYRNSIKESISCVEALAMQLLEDDSITLGKAIPKLKTKYSLHPVLMESLNKLYGYTSDEDGVRHGSPNSSTVTYIDAKFMLVACTNFINYLIEKTRTQN